MSAVLTVLAPSVSGQPLELVDFQHQNAERQIQSDDGVSDVAAHAQQVLVVGNTCDVSPGADIGHVEDSTTVSTVVAISETTTQ